MRSAIVSAIIAASIPASAFAGTCYIDRSKSKNQVSELKMTVRNESSGTFSATLIAAGDEQSAALGSSYRTESRMVAISKAETKNSDATVESSGHGFEIKSLNMQNDLLTVRFKVINSYSEVKTDGSRIHTELETTSDVEGDLFDSYDVTCKVLFSGKGKNSWHYKITIKDE